MLSPRDDYTPLSLKEGGGLKSVLKLHSLPLWVDQEEYARKWTFQHCPLHNRVLEGKGGKEERAEGREHGLRYY